MSPVERLRVCITFHYSAGRVIWLRQVLANFDQYRAAVHLTIITNTVDPVELRNIEALTGALSHATAELRCFPDLENPFDLAWMHKPIIAGEFLGGSDTHFIYLEDDIHLSEAAFDYWVQHRRPLAKRGLIPGFLRIEISPSSGKAFATDQLGFTQLDRLRMVKCGGHWFANMSSPYNPAFILDRELALEYVNSDSFAVQTSLAVKPVWETRERAAMGLCFERVPPFFWSRLMVAVDMNRLEVPTFAQIVHLPANYADDPHSSLAKLPVENLFLRPSLRNFIAERWQTIRRLATKPFRISPARQ